MGQLDLRGKRLKKLTPEKKKFGTGAFGEDLSKGPVGSEDRVFSEENKKADEENRDDLIAGAMQEKANSDQLNKFNQMNPKEQEAFVNSPDYTPEFQEFRMESKYGESGTADQEFADAPQRPDARSDAPMSSALEEGKIGKEEEEEEGEKEGKGIDWGGVASKTAKGIGAVKDQLLAGLKGADKRRDLTIESQRKSLEGIRKTALETGRQKQDAIAGMQAGFIHALQRGRK